jgi:hypothetical protein
MAKIFQLRCKSCSHMLMVFFGPFPSLNCVITISFSFCSGSKGNSFTLLGLNCVITSSFSLCSLNNVAVFVVADQRGIVLVLVLRFKYQLFLF